MTHSPGPWRYCGQDRKPREVCCCMQVWSTTADHPVAKINCGKWGDDYPSIRFTKDSTSLCPKIEPYMEMFEYGYIDKEVAEANARLIAAGPELLAACKRAEQTISRLAEDNEDRLLVSKLKAAIAKAEGTN